MRLDPEPGDLVAAAIEPGPAWLDLIGSCWDAGAAVLPVDHRLPAAAAAELRERARPTVVVGPEGARRVEGDPAGEGVVLAVATSGTAGEPKVATFDLRAVEAAASASARALGARPHDRWLCCLPPAHVGGLLVLLRALVLGAPVTVVPRFEPKALADPGIAFTSLVPTMLARALDAGVDLAHLDALLIGGAPLTDRLRRRAEDSGGRVVATYGLTESFGGVVYDGRPLAGTEVRIGADGGIELRSPSMMLGYRSDETASRAAFGDDGWLRTRDVGEIDAHGRLRVLGRVDDAVNTGGEKVWPEEVETALATCPGVAEVAVAGRPDAEWGERVVAWVVPADGARPPTLDELREHVAATLPRHAAPRSLVIVGSLPRTPNGKLRRTALEEGE